MYFPRFFTTMMGLVGVVQWMAAAPAAGEDLDRAELSVQTEKAIALMRQENWEESLKWSEASVRAYGQGAMEVYGAHFGGVYHRKGVCELKLKKWGEAMKSFETCYKEFSNKDESDPELGNPFEKTCLLPWAEAAIGAKDWKLALDLFNKFLKERDQERDDYNRGALYVDQAVCHYNLGDIAKGNENLEIAITNKNRFGISTESILGAFCCLLDVSIKAGNEQALLDFIAKNRGGIIADAFDMYSFAGAFINKARGAIDADMHRAAFEIYQLVPSPEMAINDARGKLQGSGPMNQQKAGDGVLSSERLEKGIARIELAEKNGQSLEIVKIAAIAYLHEHSGNLRGAYAGYKQLELSYPMARNREDNLFNLARVSLLVSPGVDSLQVSRKFLSFYPDSKHAPLIRHLVISSLFSERKYEECIADALDLLGTLKQGSDQHDLCLHVLGGSYFYTGQHEKAQKYLKQHVVDYPNSKSAMAAEYFQACNELRLNRYADAGVLMDAFIAKYPNAALNPFLPYAYYDRASVYFVENDHLKALKMADDLIANSSESNVMDQAHNLRGDILHSLGRPSDAEAAYKQSLRLSDRLEHRMVAGLAVRNLIHLLASELQCKVPARRLGEIVGYVDAFWSKYAQDSPYAREIAVSQIPVLEAANRLDEALERLRNVIVEMLSDPEPGGLEEKLDAYTEAYLKKHTVDQLKEHYSGFSGTKPTSGAARALLQIQVIGAYEVLAEKSKDPERKSACDAMVKSLFAHLKNDFDLKDLPSSILSRVGDYLRLKTATPREAVPFYDEVIHRDDKAALHDALLGRADVYGRSENPLDIDKALGDLDRVFKATENPDEKEFSLYHMVGLLVAKKDFSAAAEKARLYLDDAKYQKSGNAPMVGLLLAKSLEGLQMNDDAVAMYARIWAVNVDQIRVSAPAMKRYMELLWARNDPAVDANGTSGRQSAYLDAAIYINKTKARQDQMSTADLELWKEVEALMLQYEANPNVKALEQLEKEKK